jgi:hypothetical protein
VNLKTMALATPLVATPGSVLYVGLLFQGTAANLAWRTYVTGVLTNVNLAGAALRWSAITGETSLPSSIVPSSLASSSVS